MYKRLKIRNLAALSILGSFFLVAGKQVSKNSSTNRQSLRYSYIEASSAEKYHIEGGEVTSILASGKDTDNRVSIFDSRLPKGNEAPWHYHKIGDEIFYIVSGKVEFGVEQKKFIAKAGDLVIAGPYVKRRFKALKDSHLLVINSPSGPSEGFIREVANSPNSSSRVKRS